MTSTLKCVRIEALPDLFALLSGKRFEILLALTGRSCDVSSLSDDLNLSIHDVSKYLRQLRKAGLVDVRQHKNFRIYTQSQSIETTLVDKKIVVTIITVRGERMSCETNLELLHYDFDLYPSMDVASWAQ